MSNEQIPFGPSGRIVYERTYARTLPDGTRETWPQTVERVVVGNLALVYGNDRDKWSTRTNIEATELYDHMLDFRILPAGRHLWASGVKGRQYLMNCWTSGWDEKLSDHLEFEFLRLMEGGGVGANYSSHYLEPYGLPQRALTAHIVCDTEHPDYAEMLAVGVLSKEYDSDWDGAFEVPDTREGWAAALVDLIDTYMTDDDVKHSKRVYDVSNVRCKGSRLKTFGGTASGPSPFAQMMLTVSDVMNGAALANYRPRYVAGLTDFGSSEWLDQHVPAERTHLTPLEAMEIDHAIAACVVSGGVRRSARMSMVHWKDPYIFEFIKAKLDKSKHWTTNISVEIDSDFLYDLQTEGDLLAHRVHEAAVEGMLTNGEPGYWNSTLSNGGEINKVYTTNPCQPEWASVLTPSGLSTIGDIETGDTIWSRDGWTKVVDKWSTGIKPVFRYGTTAGFVDATENHRIVERGEKVELKDAEGIDRLAGVLMSESSITTEAVMDGLLLGDGYLHRASNMKPFLCVGTKDHDYYDSEVGHLFTGQENGTYGRGVETTLDHGEMSTRVWDRRIPARYMQGNRGELASVLRGLYSANGSVTGGRVTFKTTGYLLMRDIQIALSSLGIASYYTTNKPSVIKWDNGEYESRESYDLNIGRAADVATFAKAIGFLQGYKELKIATLLSERESRGQAILTSDIRSIDSLGDHEVFDIMVSNESHTYWSGGHDVSNCGEITLEQWEACNLGHVNLDAFAPDTQGSMVNYQALVKAHRLVTRFLIRATWADINDPKSREVQDRNRRIGVGHFGVQGFLAKQGIKYSHAPWFNDGEFGRTLRTLYATVRNEARNYAFELRIPEPIKVTTVAPTGSIAKLPGVTEGIHPIYGRYFNRRIRFSKSDADQNETLTRHAEEGYHIEADIQDSSGNTMVVTYPTKELLVEQVEAMGYPGVIVESADEISLEDMLEFQAMYQKAWADNAVSFTVNIPEGKYSEEYVRKTLADYLPRLKGTTLMPDGTREQAPYQRISVLDYESAIVKSVEDSTDSDCATGACPIR